MANASSSYYSVCWNKKANKWKAQIKRKENAQKKREDAKLTLAKQYAEELKLTVKTDTPKPKESKEVIQPKKKKQVVYISEEEEESESEEEEVIIVKSKPKTVKKPIIKKAPTKVDEVIQPQPTAVSYRSRGWGNGNFRFV